MDDSTDKIRRNTVVLSFLIIVSCWLQLKLPEQLKLTGLAEGIPLPSHWKVWFSISVVHFYCFSRFLFTEKGAEDRKKWRQDMEKRLERKFPAY